MPDLQDFFNALKNNLLALGSNELQEHASALLKDGEDFAKSVEDDLKTWGQQLAAGDMTVAEFELAVRGKKDLLKMEALKQAGLAAIRVDKLKDAIVGTVVAAATETLLP